MSGFVWSLSQNGLVVSELQWEIWEPDKNVARCCFLQKKMLCEAVSCEEMIWEAVSCKETQCEPYLLAAHCAHCSHCASCGLSKKLAVHLCSVRCHWQKYQHYWLFGFKRFVVLSARAGLRGLHFLRQLSQGPCLYPCHLTPLPPVCYRVSLTLRCQCRAEFGFCYRINGKVKVSQTPPQDAWWW